METGPSPALLKLHFGYCPHFLTNKIILQLPDGSIKPEKLCMLFKESSLNAKYETLRYGKKNTNTISNIIFCGYCSSKRSEAL